MERRMFLKNSLLAAGGLLLGGTTIVRLLKEEEPAEHPFPAYVEEVHRGDGKNVLLLMAAGTRRGNTDRLSDAFIRGLADGGHTVTKVGMGSMRLDGCRGCGACQRNANRCVVQDGMQELYPLFAACDMLVMASPLYFWTIASRLKAFIERLYAISVEDKYPVKDTVLLMTAGDDDATTFDHALEYFHVISSVLGGREAGVYCAGGCTGCESTERRIDPKHLDNAYKMGLEL